MAHPFEEHPTVVGSFGRQLFISDEGEELHGESEAVNPGYYRDAAHAGLQADAILSGIWQQFPNDGYMVKTAIAREVPHRPECHAAADFDFGIRLGERGMFYFVDEYTTKYRNSDDSVGRGAGAKSDDSGYQA